MTFGDGAPLRIAMAGEVEVVPTPCYAGAISHVLSRWSRLIGGLLIIISRIAEPEGNPGTRMELVRTSRGDCMTIPTTDGQDLSFLCQSSCGLSAHNFPSWTWKLRLDLCPQKNCLLTLRAPGPIEGAMRSALGRSDPSYRSV